MLHSNSNFRVLRDDAFGLLDLLLFALHRLIDALLNFNWQPAELELHY